MMDTGYEDNCGIGQDLFGIGNRNQNVKVSTESYFLALADSLPINYNLIANPFLEVRN